MAHKPYKTYKDLIKERAKNFRYPYPKMTGKTPEEGAREDLEKEIEKAWVESGHIISLEDFREGCIKDLLEED